jgi:hypothetical protein
MATKKISLNLSSGQYMSWVFGSRAGFQVTAVLKDDTKTYCNFNNKNPSINFSGILVQITGNNLRLEVDIPQSTNILVAESTGELVTTPGGEVIGYTRAYSFEDSSDANYSDLILSISTNKKY